MGVQGVGKPLATRKDKEKMKEKSRAFRNNFFAVKTVWNISKQRVVQCFINQAFGYATWVFTSAFFMKYIVQALEQEKDFFSIVKVILFMAVLCLVADLQGAYYGSKVVPLSDILVYKKLYGMIYKKARNVELECFENSAFYDKYRMAIDQAAQKICDIMTNLVRILFAAIGGIVVYSSMFLIDPFMVLFVAAPVIGNCVLAPALNRLMMKRYKRTTPYNRKLEYVNRVLHLADFSKEIRLTEIFGLMSKKYAEAEKMVEKEAERSVKKISVVTWFCNMTTYNVIFEGVILYGGYLALIRQSITLSDIAILTTLMTTASFMLMDIMDSIMKLVENGIFVENLRSFLEHKETIPDDMDGLDPGTEIESIEFRDVSFSYEEGKMTLEHLNFKFEKNQEIALVGHNGAGKSTIVKLLFRLYDPTEGEILLNGRNIKEYNLKKYRELFAAAFQDYKIFAFSVRDNVMMRRCGTEVDEEVEIALKKAGLWEKIQSLPKGLDENLTREFDEDGIQLSGGEFQKLVAARAFVKSAPVKVFDEPSSALDPIAEYELFESIRKEGEGKMMIFISHRLSSVKNADMVYMLEHGRVIEAGSHNELMKQDGVYADMYRKQAENYLPGGYHGDLLVSTEGWEG